MEKQNKLLTQSKLGVLAEVGGGSDSDNSLKVEKESQEN